MAEIVTAICHHCGKEFERAQSSLGIYKHDYCSPYCVTAHQRKRVTCTCDGCGNEFEVTEGKARAAVRHYCSRACRRRRIEVPCGHCGQVIEVQQYKVEQSATGKFFCDKKCFRAWEAATKIPVTCKECGREFLRYEHHAARQEDQFCNAKCHGAYQGRMRQGESHPRWVSELLVNCDHCGKEFRQKARTRLQRNKHNFCSNECSSAWMAANEVHVGENNPNWKGGHPDYYGPNWYRQQRATRKRDGYKCQCCGKAQKKGRALDVHHIVPFRVFGYIRNQNDLYKLANDLTNLITLCPQCHAKAEAQLIPIQPTLLSF